MQILLFEFNSIVGGTYMVFFYVVQYKKIKKSSKKYFSILCIRKIGNIILLSTLLGHMGFLFHILWKFLIFSNYFDLLCITNLFYFKNNYS